MGPGDLHAAVRGLFEDVERDPAVLVGFDTLDDAGVYRLNARQALVQTVDFITPVVDDPFAYGEIAVANALSDVYAMGGRPITALNVVCFPAGLDPHLLHEILRGGLAKLREAEVALLGGHTVDDPEIKYGAAVTGLVDPDRVLTNAGARPGDLLILTKPLGTGVAATGIKQSKAAPETVAAALASMRALNRPAREAMVEVGVHACTDITGFSLLGHLAQLARASHVGLRLEADRVPLIPGVRDLAAIGLVPGGVARNRDYFGPQVQFAPSLDGALIDLLFDPQTSGGLAICVAREKRDHLLEALTARGVVPALIGEAVAGPAGAIQVV